jgi:hypothetical protein
MNPNSALAMVKRIGEELGSKTVEERIKVAKYPARNPHYSRLVKERAE